MASSEVPIGDQQFDISEELANIMEAEDNALGDQLLDQSFHTQPPGSPPCKYWGVEDTTVRAGNPDTPQAHSRSVVPAAPNVIDFLSQRVTEGLNVLSQVAPKVNENREALERADMVITQTLVKTTKIYAIMESR